MARGMLTSTDGPVVTGQRTLRALIAIRKDKLLRTLYGRVVIARSVAESMAEVLTEPRDWLVVVDDAPPIDLPPRVEFAEASDQATLRLALSIPASLVLLDGPVKEKAKLSFIKAEGAVSILVQAHREGYLSAVRPMVKALEALGYSDVLPPPEALEALWTALDALQ